MWHWRVETVEVEAALDYNIMMGNLEDPEEDEGEEEIDG